MIETYTPGPWKIVTKRNRKGGRVCTAVIRDGQHEGLGGPEIAWLKSSVEDGALIAAAPDLLKACELASSGWKGEQDDEWLDGMLETVRSAIRKATEG